MNTFDFGVVQRQIIKAYRQSDLSTMNSSWDLDAVIEVFRYFYALYYKVFGVEHPRLKSETIQTIIDSLGFCDGGERELYPEDYPSMIDSYFNQNFTKCNYSITHFMSGDIRLYRLYETMYL